MVQPKADVSLVTPTTFFSRRQSQQLPVLNPMGPVFGRG